MDLGDGREASSTWKRLGVCRGRWRWGRGEDGVGEDAERDGGNEPRRAIAGLRVKDRL